MKLKDSKYIDLITEMRQYIIQDWGEQRKKGHRDYDVSWPRFDKELYKRYPDIFKKTTFKAINTNAWVNAQGGRQREYPLQRVQYILRYFYLDLDVKDGWPHTTKFLSEYEGGKYLPLIESSTKGQTPGDIGRAVTDMLDRHVTESDQPFHIQLAQLAVRAKEEFERLERENNNLKKQIDQHDELIKQVEAERQALREDLAGLEGVLIGKEGDKSEILKQKIG